MMGLDHSEESVCQLSKLFRRLVGLLCRWSASYNISLPAQDSAAQRNAGVFTLVPQMRFEPTNCYTGVTFIVTD